MEHIPWTLVGLEAKIEWLAHTDIAPIKGRMRTVENTK